MEENNPTPDSIRTPIMSPYNHLNPEYEFIYPTYSYYSRKEEELKIYKVTLNDKRELVLKHTKINAAHQIKAYNLIKEYYITKIASLFTPNVIQVLDLMIDKNKDVAIEMLMEYGGKDLETIELRKGDSIKIAEQLIDCLAVLESVGISHIDIKPKNVLYQNGIAKLIDFAAAISFYECPKELMEPLNDKRYKIGGYTKAYAPIELYTQPLQHSVCPQKADAYSFGLTFGYMLLRENELYKDSSEIRTALEVLFQKDSTWKGFIKKCFCDNPSDRPSFKELQRQFKEILINTRSVNKFSTIKQKPTVYKDINSIEELKSNLKIAILDKIGNVYTASEWKYVKLALDYFSLNLLKNAKSIYKNISNTLELVTFYNYLGIAYYNLWKFKDALIYYNKAIKLIKNKYGNTHIKLCYLYNNLAVSYMNIGEYIKALRYFIKTKNFWKDIHKPQDKTEYINLYNNLGCIYYNTEQYHSAIIYFRKAIQYKSKETFITLYNNIASSYLKLQDYSKFIYYWELLNNSIKNDNIKLSFMYNNLGLAYANTDKNKAIEYCRNLIETFNKSGKSLSESRYYLAIVYTKIEHFNSAIEEIRILIKEYEINHLENSGDLILLYKILAKIYTNIGNINEAIVNHHKVINILIQLQGPTHNLLAEEFTSMGKLYYAKKDYEKVIECCEKAIDIRRHNNDERIIEDIMIIGELLSTSGKYSEAISYYTEALKLHEQEFMLCTRIATNYINMKDYKKALEYFYKAKEHASDEELITAYKSLGMAHNYLNQYEDAIQNYNNAIKMANNKASLELAQLHYDIGDLYNKVGRYNEAIENCKIAIELAGKDYKILANSYYILSLSYSNNNQHTIAIYTLKPLISTLLKHNISIEMLIKAYLDIGKLYTRIELVKLAIEYLKKSVDISITKKKDHFEHLLAAYGYLAKICKEEEAVEYRIKAIDLLEEVSGRELPELVNVYKDLALALFLIGRYSDSIKYYDKALKYLLDIDEENDVRLIVPYNNMAAGYNYLRDYEKCIEYASKAINIVKKKYGENKEMLKELYYNIGIAYIKTRRYEKALNILNEFKEEELSHKERISFCNNMALLYNLKKNSSLAMEYAIKVQNLLLDETHNEIVKDITQRLNTLKDDTKEDKSFIEKTITLLYNNLSSTYQEQEDNKSINYSKEVVSTDIYAYYNKGVALLKQKNVKQALDIFEDIKNIMKGEPLDFLYNAMGILNYIEGNKSIAIKEFEKGIELAKEDVNKVLLYKNIAKVQYEMDSYKYSLENYKKALSYSTNSDSIYLYNNIGLILFNQKEYEAARDNFNKAVNIYIECKMENNKVLINLYNGLGLSHSMLKNIDEAIECLTKSLEIIYKNNIEECSKEAMLAHNHLMAMLNMKGRYYDVVDFSRKLLNTLNKFDMTFLYTFTMHKHLKTAYYNLGQYKKVINCFTKAIDDIYPLCSKDTIALNNNIGVVYNKLGMYDRAMEYYKSIDNEGHVKSACVLNNYGATYYNLGKYKEAIKYFVDAKKLDNNPFQVIIITFNLVLAYSRVKERVNAQNYLDECKELSKLIEEYNKLTDNNVNKIYKLIATLLYNKQDFKGAITYYHKALQCTNMNIMDCDYLYLNLTEAYNNIENYEEALLCINKISNIEELPKKAKVDVYKALAMVYYNIECYDEAIDYSKAGINLVDDNNADLHIILASSYNCKGQHEEAINEITKPLEVLKQNIIYYKIKSEAYLHLKKYKETRKLCNEAIKLIQANGNKKYELLFYYNKAILHSFNRPKRALDNCLRALRVAKEVYKKESEEESEELVIVYNYLGYGYLLNGDYSKAAETFERIIRIIKKKYDRIHPELIKVYYKLKIIYYKQKNYMSSAEYAIKEIEAIREMYGDKNKMLLASYEYLRKRMKVFIKNKVIEVTLAIDYCEQELNLLHALNKRTTFVHTKIYALLSYLTH